MPENQEHVLTIPGGKTLFAISEIPAMTAAALWPDQSAHNDESERRILLRAIAKQEHASALADAIHDGAVIPRSPTSHTPLKKPQTKAKTGAPLQDLVLAYPDALMSLDDLRKFVADLDIRINIEPEDSGKKLPKKSRKKSITQIDPRFGQFKDLRASQISMAIGEDNALIVIQGEQPFTVKSVDLGFSPDSAGWRMLQSAGFNQGDISTFLKSLNSSYSPERNRGSVRQFCSRFNQTFRAMTGLIDSPIPRYSKSRGYYLAFDSIMEHRSKRGDHQYRPEEFASTGHDIDLFPDDREQYD